MSWALGRRFGNPAEVSSADSVSGIGRSSESRSDQPSDRDSAATSAPSGWPFMTGRAGREAAEAASGDDTGGCIGRAGGGPGREGRGPDRAGGRTGRAPDTGGSSTEAAGGLPATGCCSASSAWSTGQPSGTSAPRLGRAIDLGSISQLSRNQAEVSSKIGLSSWPVGRPGRPRLGPVGRRPGSAIGGLGAPCLVSSGRGGGPPAGGRADGSSRRGGIGRGSMRSPS
jgi:hypothetical protein